MRRECSKHEVERHLLDGKAGPGGNKSNRDLRGYPRSAWARGLHVEFLEHLNGEGKICARKDLSRDYTFFCLHTGRADGVQKNVCINEACHVDKVPLALPDEKHRIVQSWRKTPLGDVPIF